MVIRCLEIKCCTPYIQIVGSEHGKRVLVGVDVARQDVPKKGVRLEDINNY